MQRPTRIMLVRHGETIWNRELRLQGSQDIPLTPVGEQQAERVARRLSDEPYRPHAVYSSPLQRAHKTAGTLARALQASHDVHDGLRERHFGELEGLTREQITERFPDFWGPEHKVYDIPGLESFPQVSERALQTVSELADRHPDEEVLIVSHGGFINAFLHKISDGKMGSGVNKLGNTSITRVVREKDGNWTILGVGDAAHLDEE
jgi:2,3-bisphosphoglycerate-dependent phosphoglycerate mutase